MAEASVMFAAVGCCGARVASCNAWLRGLRHFVLWVFAAPVCLVTACFLPVPWCVLVDAFALGSLWLLSHPVLQSLCSPLHAVSATHTYVAFFLLSSELGVAFMLFCELGAL
jgi:hypothetical protein